MLSLQSAGVAAVLLGLAVHLPWTLLQFTHLSQEPAPDVSYPHAAEYFYNVVRTCQQSRCSQIPLQ